MKRAFLMLPLLLLLISFTGCKENNDPVPEGEIPLNFVYNLPLPYELLKEQLTDGSVFYLQDLEYYNEPLDFLSYLYPLLHSMGYNGLDLWFIPQDQKEPFEEWIYNETCDRDLLINNLKSISLTLLQQRYEDFFVYLWKFQQTLGENELPVSLGIPGYSERYISLLKSSQDLPEGTWRIYGPHWEGRAPYDPQQIIQAGGTNRCLILEDEAAQVTQYLVLLSHPEEFQPTELNIQEITQEDIPLGLSEFSEIRIKNPPFMVLRMIRKQLKKRMIRNL